MQIEIPDELIGRLRLHMAPGASEVDALRQVLDDVDGVNIEPLSEHELCESLAMLGRRSRGAHEQC